MATPHVAGAVALQLQPSGFPVIPTPAQIQNAIVANATWNVVGNRGTGSPNTLLFVGQYEFSDFLRPLFRYLNGIDHFYTTDWSEIGAGSGNYIVEGIQAKIFNSQANGTVPLYRYYNQSNSDHFYTINFSELGNGGYGYVSEGITGYVLPSAQSGYVPLYRYLNTMSGDHFYTTNFSELGNGGGVWVYEGIECYVLPYN